MTLDQFAGITARFYEAGLDPSLWGSALDRLLDITGGRTAALIETRAGSQMAFRADRCDQSGMDAFNAYYGGIEPLTSKLLPRARKAVVTTPEAWDSSHPGYAEFFNDWAVPNDSSHAILSNLVRGTTVVSFGMGHRRQEFVDAANVSLAELLMPHLALAARAWTMLGDVRIAEAADIGVLERLRHAVVVCDAGLVRHANTAALRMLGRPDGLSLGHYRIAAADGIADAAIQRALRAALVGEPKSGSRLAIPRPSGRRAFILTILPLPREALSGHPGAALCIVTDPEREISLDADGLRRLFGLTRSEVSLAIAMLRGGTIKATAEELGVSLSTARIHLSRVFQKTQTHKQSQLVRLLVDLGAF